MLSIYIKCYLYEKVATFIFTYVINYDDGNIAIEALVDTIDDSDNIHCSMRSRQIFSRCKLKSCVAAKLLSYSKRRQKYFWLHKSNLQPKLFYTNVRN